MNSTYLRSRGPSRDSAEDLHFSVFYVGTVYDISCFKFSGFTTYHVNISSGQLENVVSAGVSMPGQLTR